jgi:Tfp pilus assembly protein PilE
MKRTFKSMLGVTLLEIMLVMAIAAMVIVMSIRYYQSASSNQRVAAGADVLTGFVGAAVSYIQAGNTIASITNTTLAPYLPGATIPISPWGSSITVTGATATFTVSIGGVPPTDCFKIQGLMASNPNIAWGASCTAGSGAPATMAATITP